MRRPASSCDRPRRRTAFTIRITRPDFIFSFSASRKPRSAKTLPELNSASRSLMTRLRIAHILYHLLSDLQTFADDVQVRFRCFNAVFALFLEYMQHEYCFLEFNRVDGSVRAAAAIRDDLQNSRAAKALKNLRRLVLIAVLRKVQGMTEKLPDGNGQHQQVSLAAPYPDQWFFMLSSHV